MKIFWIIAYCLACAWFSYVVLINPVLGAAMRKWGSSAADKIGIALLGSMLALHGGLGVALSFLTTTTIVVVMLSLIAYAWTLIAYFLLQRFAGTLERAVMVSENPNFYPVAAFIAFAASTTACIVYVRWFVGVLPLAVWFVVGFMCAEIAIRRYMSQCARMGSKCDRELAVFAVNSVQGGYEFTGRYPFP